MGNYSNDLLKTYKKMEEVATQYDVNLFEVFKDFKEIYEDHLALKLKEEYENRTAKKGVLHICKKYKITTKKLYTLIKKAGVKTREYRDLRGLITNTITPFNPTEEEKTIIFKYFLKAPFTEEKVIRKLKQIRA